MIMIYIGRQVVVFRLIRGTRVTEVKKQLFLSSPFKADDVILPSRRILRKCLVAETLYHEIVKRLLTQEVFSLNRSAG